MLTLSEATNFIVTVDTGQLFINQELRANFCAALRIIGKELDELNRNNDVNQLVVYAPIAQKLVLLLQTDDDSLFLHCQNALIRLSNSPLIAEKLYSESELLAICFDRIPKLLAKSSPSNDNITKLDRFLKILQFMASHNNIRIKAVLIEQYNLIQVVQTVINTPELPSATVRNAILVIGHIIKNSNPEIRKRALEQNVIAIFMRSFDTEKCYMRALSYFPDELGSFIEHMKVLDTCYQDINLPNTGNGFDSLIILCNLDRQDTYLSQLQLSAEFVAEYREMIVSIVEKQILSPDVLVEVNLNEKKPNIRSIVLQDMSYFLSSLDTLAKHPHHREALFDANMISKLIEVTKNTAINREMHNRVVRILHRFTIPTGGITETEIAQAYINADNLNVFKNVYANFNHIQLCIFNQNKDKGKPFLPKKIVELIGENFIGLTKGL